MPAAGDTRPRRAAGPGRHAVGGPDGAGVARDAPTHPDDDTATPRRPRIILIDLARAAALLGMGVFHFGYDLEIFGWLAPGTMVSGFFWWLARIVAGSFIFIAGVSLWLAHGRRFRPRAFWRRLIRVAAAALLITGATAIAVPEITIFYGILHSIAVSSLVAILFLRAPLWLMIAVAGVVFALPWFWAHPALDGGLIWLGLSGRVPITADFEPFFPWFAPCLAGLILARVMTRFDLWHRVTIEETPLLRRLAWPGRHSLAIYLLHQPVLISLVYAASWLLRGF